MKVDISAGGTLFIIAPIGIYQNIDYAGTVQSSVNLHSDTAVDIAGTTAGIYVYGVSCIQTTVIDAPEINVAATAAGGFAVFAKENGFITFGNAETASVVNLEAPDSWAVYVSYDDSEGSQNPSLNFVNSTVNVTGATQSYGTISLTDSLYNLEGSSTFTTAKIAGSNATIVVNELPAAAAALQAAVQVDSGNAVTTTGLPGAISDGWQADADGTMTVTLNPALEGYKNFNAMTLVQWRSESNHISQRLGDVRDRPGEVGGWASVYGYDGSYDKGTSIDFKAHSVQAGGDFRENDTWLVGGAVSWTTGDGSFSNGSSDMDGWSAVTYLSGFFENGAYVDVVGSAGRLSTDISASSGSSVFTAHYANTTLGASVEAGWRLNLSKSVFIEQQAELGYGFVQGDAFTGANGLSVDQDGFETLVSRLGVRVGKTFAHHAGSVYAHASWNHECRGEADYTARLGDVVRSEGVDLGGSWMSFGVGGQLNQSKHLALYGSLERFEGSDYDEDYRYTVGVRWTD